MIGVNYFFMFLKNINKLKNKNFSKLGFSLMEVIVSVSIFSIMILSATQIFSLVIDGQRGAIASQNVQESMKYFLEVIAKEMRMALPAEFAGDCNVASAGQIFYLFEGVGSDTLYFKNYQGECVVYTSVLDSNLVRRFRINRAGNVGFISPSQVSIESLNFILSSAAGTQPLVSVNISAKSLNSKQMTTAMSLQTSVSSRYYKK